MQSSLFARSLASRQFSDGYEESSLPHGFELFVKIRASKKSVVSGLSVGRRLLTSHSTVINVYEKILRVREKILRALRDFPLFSASSPPRRFPRCPCRKSPFFPCARIIQIRSTPPFQKKMRPGRKKTRKSFAGSGKGSNFALAFGNEGHRRPPGVQKNSSLTDWKTSNKAAVLDERKQDRQAYTSIRHPSRNRNG